MPACGSRPWPEGLASCPRSAPALDACVAGHLHVAVEGQELDVLIRYWEGAVHVQGTSSGVPVSGDGYVEMTGYAGIQGGRS